MACHSCVRFAAGFARYGSHGTTGLLSDDMAHCGQCVCGKQALWRGCGFAVVGVVDVGVGRLPFNDACPPSRCKIERRVHASLGGKSQIVVASHTRNRYSIKFSASASTSWDLVENDEEHPIDIDKGAYR